VKNGIMLLDFSETLHARASRSNGDRPRRRDPAAADPDDDLLHAVRLLPLALGLGAGAELQRRWPRRHRRLACRRRSR
jgi:hypothetical protein